MVTMVRRRMAGNRVGLIFLFLAVVGAVCALGLAAYYHLGTAATATTLLPSMAGLYLSWATFQAGRPDLVMGRDLATIAGDLAHAVDSQWREEARLRRLNDPYPLPVSWSSAPEALVEAWPVVSATASQWPGGPPGQPGDWASEPGELAGQWAQIVRVFRGHVPTHRLVVLGEPGSGKTMLLVRLVQGLLAERAAGKDLPVPVIFSLASWNPARQDLFAWMGACMERDYLGLEQQAPAPYQQVSRARALLNQRLVLPVLDGFDEMPGDGRPAALDAINQSLPAGQGLVLSSRIEEFRRTVSAPESVSVRLDGAAGIELRSLDAQTVGAYLLRDAGGDAFAEQRWAPVIEQLGTASPIGLTLRTPLMLFLARTIYNPRPGERRGTALPDPRTLCDETGFPDRQAVERHLLSSFIPACYRPSLAASPPVWDAQRAQRVFVFLARHLEHAMKGIPDIAWWQLPSALPRRVSTALLWIVLMTSVGAPFAGMAGAVAGLAFGLVRILAGDPWSMAGVAVLNGVIGGVVMGATFGVTSGATVHRSFGLRPMLAPLNKKETTPVTSFGWSWNKAATSRAILLGALTGTVIGVFVNNTYAITVASFVAVTNILWGGIRADPADVTSAVAPDVLLANDRHITIKGLGTFILIGSAVVGTLVALLSRTNIYEYLHTIGNPVVLGAIAGLIAGVIAEPSRSAWWSFTVTRWHLSLSHGLPRNLMAFLGDAHRRGVLRQVGGVYQFRHLDLQRYLADR